MLKEAGLEVSLNPHKRKLTEVEVEELLRDIDGLIAGVEPLTEKVMKSASRLKVISRCGVGMDSVDLEAAEKLGIKVFNTPDAVTPAVAELTIGLMLSCLRHIPQSHDIIKNGHWSKQMGYLLKGKRVGIIGFGRIGAEVGRLVSAFGADVLYHDPADVSCPAGAECVDKDTLIQSADIISLHASCGKRQCPLIGSDEIKKMKNSAMLINTSRGELVDEQALYYALSKGEVLAAGIDVFQNEPYTGPLRELDNVVLTCHIGSYAKEARARMELEAAENLLRGLGL
jgi:D-3-phosphoglycerate dehydrogenase